jgi:hypothetical protein
MHTGEAGRGVVVEDLAGGARGPTIATTPPEEWDGLIQSFPDHTVFHGLAWLEAVAAARHLNLVLAQARVGTRCVGVWPVLEWRRGPLRAIGSPLPGCATPYLGPLVRDDVEPLTVLAAFLRHRHFRRYLYFGCRVLDERRPVDLRPFGFVKARDVDTYRLDLRRSVDQLWAGLKSECRTRIRKAEKLGVEVREETDSGFLADFWAMAEQTFALTGIRPIYSRAFLDELWRRLTAARQLWVLSAVLAGHRIATLVLPFDQHTLYYWAGASYGRWRQVPAHNLLHWHAIRRAQAHGLARYDFISTLGSHGRFKRTFGPEAVRVTTRWDRSPSPALRLLKDVYERYQLRQRHLGHRRPAGAPAEDSQHSLRT